MDDITDGFGTPIGETISALRGMYYEILRTLRLTCSTSATTTAAMTVTKVTLTEWLTRRSASRSFWERSILTNDSNDGSIAGTVKDNNGKPVTGVPVQLWTVSVSDAIGVMLDAGETDYWNFVDSDSGNLLLQHKDSEGDVALTTVTSCSGV